MAAPPISRLAVINGLRGIAISQVITQHVLTGMFTPSALTLNVFGVTISFSPLVTNGWTGVNLFFLLSGFVLFLPYADGHRAMLAIGDRIDFYKRRCRRLLPLFVVAVVAAWALALWRGVPTGTGELISVLSLTYIFDPQTFGPSFNIALWSIGVEMGFSAVFPLLVLGLRQHGSRRFAIAIIILALAARIVGILRSPTLQGPTISSDTIVCRLDEFVIGMVLAQSFVNQTLPRRTWLYASIGLALVGLAWVGFDQVLRGGMPPLARAWLNNVLDVGLVALIAAALTSTGRLAAVLTWPPLQVIGMMCYSLYLWHWPLLQWLAPDRAAMQPTVLAFAFLVFLATTFALSALTYRFIEFRQEPDWRKLFLFPRADVAVA